MNFSGKEGHSNNQPSIRPGIDPGTSGLGGRDLTTAPTPPLWSIEQAAARSMCQARRLIFPVKTELLRFDGIRHKGETGSRRVNHSF